MAEYVPSTQQWVRDQVERIESSGGREGMTLRGLPVVLVTMTGRRSGAIRKVPLMRVVHDGTYVLVGSVGGGTKHPRWYYNLLEHPEVTVRDGTEVFEGRARLVEDPEERERLWATAVESFPNYADYQQRTKRQIPLFAIERS